MGDVLFDIYYSTPAFAGIGWEIYMVNEMGFIFFSKRAQCYYRCVLISRIDADEGVSTGCLTCIEFLARHYVWCAGVLNGHAAAITLNILEKEWSFSRPTPLSELSLDYVAWRDSLFAPFRWYLCVVKLPAIGRIWKMLHITAPHSRHTQSGRQVLPP